MIIVKEFVVMDAKAKLVVQENAKLLGNTDKVSEITYFACFDAPLEFFGLRLESCPIFGNRVFCS